MIKIDNVEVVGWEHAIRGMRNPMNSWSKSDSIFCDINGCSACKYYDSCKGSDWAQTEHSEDDGFLIGKDDLDLMKRLAKAGTDHSKYLRMITVYCDVNAPLYWWKEYDTYKVGTVRDSCSTMHKIQSKEFTVADFSYDHLTSTSMEHLLATIKLLNSYRETYNKNVNKSDWWQMIQLLPSSYNQKATLMLNYQVLKNMYHSRKNHKLDEWREFCKWVESLPYSELITLE